MFKPSARFFPLGTVLEGETADYNPNNFYIDGVWELTQKGMVSVGLDTSQTEFNTIGKTGGTKTHKLTIAELAKHNHNTENDKDNAIPRRQWVSLGSDLFNIGDKGYPIGTMGSVGGNQPHNNLQPYKVVYKWKLISYSN